MYVCMFVCITVQVCHAPRFFCASTNNTSSTSQSMHTGNAELTAPAPATGPRHGKQPGQELIEVESLEEGRADAPKERAGRGHIGAGSGSPRRGLTDFGGKLEEVRLQYVGGIGCAVRGKFAHTHTHTCAPDTQAVEEYDLVEVRGSIPNAQHEPSTPNAKPQAPSFLYSDSCVCVCSP